MESSDPETLHASIVGLSKSHKSQTIQSSSLLTSEPPNNSGVKNSVFKKLLGLMTLNGHLLPGFLLSNDHAILWMTSEHSEWWPKVFAKKRVIISREGNNSVSQHEMSRLAVIGILIRWFQLVIKAGTKWSSVSSAWRNSFTHLTSIKFWTKYLKLNEQSS